MLRDIDEVMLRILLNEIFDCIGISVDLPVFVITTLSRLDACSMNCLALPDRIPWGAMATTLRAPRSFRKPANNAHGSTSSIMSSRTMATWEFRF